MDREKIGITQKYSAQNAQNAGVRKLTCLVGFRLRLRERVKPYLPIKNWQKRASMTARCNSQ